MVVDFLAFVVVEWPLPFWRFNGHAMRLLCALEGLVLDCADR